MQQKGRAHVQLKHRKSIRFRKVRVPKANRAVQRQFTRQQIIHPAKGELQVIDAVQLQVAMQGAIDASNQLFQLIHLGLNAELRKNVIVLNAVEELGQAPKGVRFDDVSLLLREIFNATRFNFKGGRQQFLQEHDKEGREEVIDALHVARGGVSNGPNEEDALEHCLHPVLLKEWHLRSKIYF